MFKELKNRIQRAPACRTLASVIDGLLDEGFPEGNLGGNTVKAVLGQHRIIKIGTTKSLEFVNSLRNTHEISPIRMNFIYEKILTKMMELTRERDWGKLMPCFNGGLFDKTLNKKIPQTIGKMRNEIKDCLARNMDPKEILKTISKLAEAGHGNWLTSQLHWRSSSVNDFYEILKDMENNIYNPTVLNKISSQLARYDIDHFESKSVDTDALSVRPSMSARTK